jgi:hypothetical protein
VLEGAAGSPEGNGRPASEDAVEPTGDRRALPAMAIAGLVAAAAAGGSVLLRGRRNRIG